MKTTAQIKKMSDTVIACELRAAYLEVECNIRHGIQPSKTVSDYVWMLTQEQERRAK